VDPPPPTPTLWNFLGIPQTIDKIQDAGFNRSGNNPGWERTPALKQIADPANLNSPNPAIKTAAKIKADQDAAPQKIKAIKYLATVGCGCYPGVKDALLAALDDCTEEVRYEAAIAFCKAAGNPCKNCEKNGCCDAAVMNKLNDMAYGQDDKGCYKEASERVRAAATNALNACQRMHPQGAPQPQTTPGGKKELPQQPLTPSPAPKEVPLSLPPETPLPAPLPPDHKTSSTGGKASVPIIEAGFARVSPGDPDSPATVPTSVAAVDPRGPYCQPPGGVSGAPFAAPGTGPEAGTQTSGEGAAAEAAPSPNALAGNFGAAVGPLSAAPNMIGDFFGGGGLITISAIHTPGPNTIIGTAPLPAGAVPRFKFAEDTNPMPQDRVFFDYDYYHDVPLNAAAHPNIGVNAYTPGFEKTFLGGLVSLELRLPMATTLDDNVFFDGTSNTSHGEIGNLTLAAKGLLIRRDTYALSGGLTMTLPTAEGEQYFFSQGNQSPFMTAANQSVHLMPFFGALWTPNDRLFAIGYLQVDVDVNGDPITVGTTGIGRFRDATMLYLDLSLGYWVRRSECATDLVTGLAPVVELHVNQSLDAPSTLNSASTGFSVSGGASNPFTNLNLTVGGEVELRKNTTLTAGYCAPLTFDREFDGQFRFFINHCF